MQGQRDLYPSFLQFLLKVKIAFLTSHVLDDVNQWSGTSYYMYKSLSQLHSVIPIGSGLVNQLQSFSLDNFASSKDLDRYVWLLGKLYSERIRSIPNLDCVIFGNLYTDAFMERKVPYIHLSDTNFHMNSTILHYGSEFSLRKEKIERIALHKYNSIIYSSTWAKRNTIDYYGIDSHKIHVVELGANIPPPKDFKLESSMDICNLVFIGRNWKEKGGQKVLDAYKLLKYSNFPCTLTCIGTIPPHFDASDKSLRIYPFLDKSIPEHLSLLCSILRESHFLILPTEFDAYGIVFCEASAYGCPSLATDVGGVCQPVKEGKNGFLFPKNTKSEDYAEKIRYLWSNPTEYQQLRATSRYEYETRLNWDIWSKKVTKIFEQTVEQYKNEQKS